MSDQNKRKKIIDIFNEFYRKINKIEADKKKLEANLQTEQDQLKLSEKKSQNK
ncbi:MAG: hypothetical protein GF365_03065 [Candidatus Buchananbacteria bacterium]|nr:hypothetical protein [Candidatus Buchananbacteria bacterium]